MSLRRILATVAVALGSSVLSAHAVSPSAAHAASSWTEVSTTVDVPCYVFTYHQAADWYFPATSSPKGLVYLQHGFSRSNGNMRDPAEHYAAAGFPVFAPTLPSADLYGCTVSNMGNNNPFLNDVAAWLGTATGSTGNLAKSYATAATKAGRSGQALPSKCVIAGHSAGSESATYVANRLRTTYPAAFAKLRFVQLLDPVTSAFGNNEPAALAGLATTSLPILAISSPPHLGNGNASGTVALTDALDRAFLGVRLVTVAIATRRVRAPTRCAPCWPARRRRGTSRPCRPWPWRGRPMRPTAPRPPPTTRAARTTRAC